MKSIKRPSPAIVVAVLALVLALGGSAYAVTIAPTDSVRTSSIKDGEVRSRDVLNNTLRGPDIATASVGARVLADNAVDSGELAPLSVGSDELSGVTTVTSNSGATVDADGTTNGGAFTHVGVTAQCPVGTVLLHGGARWVEPSNGGSQNSAVFIQEQYRSGSGNAWTVEGIVDFGASGNIKLQAQAYCLEAGNPAS